MTDLRCKDFCLDANRPDAVGPFWAGVLGLADERQEDGDHVLRGAWPEQTVWVNAVPEPMQGKSRVHLDVRTSPGPALPAELTRPRGEGSAGEVYLDPDGLVLCAVNTDEHRGPGAFELVVDAAEPLQIANWRAQRMGASVHQQQDKPWVWLQDVTGFPWQYWVFNLVPESKTVKNRMHWDVTLVDAGLEDVTAAGASVLRPRYGWIGWTVLADPEGNEFCAF